MITIQIYLSDGSIIERQYDPEGFTVGNYVNYGLMVCDLIMRSDDQDRAMITEIKVRSEQWTEDNVTGNVY